MSNTLSIKIPRLEILCMYLSRLCVYVYSLVFFLKTVFPFPPSLDGYLRFGIAIFGLFAVVLTQSINIHHIHVSKYFIWLLGLLAISLFSNLYSPSADAISFSSNIFDSLFIGVCFSTSIRDEESIKRYMFFFSICGGIVFLVLLSRNLLYVDDRLGRSLTGDNTNSFALYLMLTLFAAIGSFYLSDNQLIRVFSAILGVIDLFMLMLSGGRKYVLVPLILVISISLFQTQGKKNFLKRLGLIGIIVISILLAWNLMMTNSILYNSIGYRFANLVSISNRELYVVKGFGFFLESPIWGHGENSFSELIIPYHGSRIYSHNNYVELLTNFGLIGFAWFYYFFGNALSRNFQVALNTKNKIHIFAACLMISMLFLDLGIVSYSDSSLLFTFWVLSFNVAYKISTNNDYHERSKVATNAI